MASARVSCIDSMLLRLWCRCSQAACCCRLCQALQAAFLQNSTDSVCQLVVLQAGKVVYVGLWFQAGKRGVARAKCCVAATSRLLHTHVSASAACVRADLEHSDQHIAIEGVLCLHCTVGSCAQSLLPGQLLQACHHSQSSITCGSEATATESEAGSSAH